MVASILCVCLGVAIGWTVNPPAWFVSLKSSVGL